MSLASFFRRYLRRKVRLAGFQRRIAPDFVDVMIAHDVKVVLDVGANDGAYGREIRDAGYTGMLISFEPNPKAFERLQKSIVADPSWICFPYALGEEDGLAALTIAENDVMSSFKGLTEFGKRTGAKAAETVQVKMMRLDSFFREHPELLNRVYLKIDTQGFESEVLRGAGHLLSSLLAVQAEIALVHTYKDEPHWLDFLCWMRSQHFEVATAVCNSALGAQVREFDFVFVKS